MSIKLKLAVAVFALAAASLSVQGTALAEAACNGTWYKSLGGRYFWQCYYLPTVANGRVTGLDQHINHHVCRRVAGRHHDVQTVCSN